MHNEYFLLANKLKATKALLNNTLRMYFRIALAYTDNKLTKFFFRENKIGV